MWDLDCFQHLSKTDFTGLQLLIAKISLEPNFFKVKADQISKSSANELYLGLIHRKNCLSKVLDTISSGASPTRKPTNWAGERKVGTSKRCHDFLYRAKLSTS